MFTTVSLLLSISKPQQYSRGESFGSPLLSKRKNMKRIIILFLLIFSVFSYALADRNKPTITAYTSDTLIKRGDWKIYRIDFIATSSGGNFTIYDALDANDGYEKTEGSEATSGNGKPIDFSNKPLEGSTGLYLKITTASVIIQYE